MTNELQTVGRNEIVWTDDQAKLIKDTICRGATDDELKLFLYTCKRCGLDPLAKQIYAVKRWDSALRREVMTIQTGIDGYRVVAERSGGYAGVDEPKFTFDDKNNLESASVTVYRIVSGQRVGFNGTAFWDEYVQTTKEGTPTRFWQKMPRSQLAKCAEALALRRAFPNDLSGIYTKEEMDQADNPKPENGSNLMEGPDNIKELRPFPAKWKTKCFVCGEVHPAGTQIISVPNMEKTFASAQCWDSHCAEESPEQTTTPEPSEVENKRAGYLTRIMAGEKILSDNKIALFDSPDYRLNQREKWIGTTELENATTHDLGEYLTELLRLAKEGKKL